VCPGAANPGQAETPQILMFSCPAIEDPEQFGFVGVQPFQEAVERSKAGAPAEDAIKAGAQFAAPTGGGAGSDLPRWNFHPLGIISFCWRTSSRV
jgi:hypothetical protein